VYTLRFPRRLLPKLEEFFIQHEILEKVSFDGNEIVVRLDDQEYVPFYLNVYTSRYGPREGWPRCPDSVAVENRSADLPQTEPSDGMDFR
jgi:hypothetical protein